MSRPVASGCSGRLSPRSAVPVAGAGEGGGGGGGAAAGGGAVQGAGGAVRGAAAEPSPWGWMLLGPGLQGKGRPGTASVSPARRGGGGRWPRSPLARSFLPPPPALTLPFCARRTLAGISLQVDSLTDHSCSAESDGEKLPCRAGDPLCESGSECKDKYEDIEEEEEDEDEEEEEEDIEEDDGGGGERDPPAKPATSSPLAAVEAPLLGHPHADAARSASKAALGGRASPGPPTPASKPKLWSLAEIATSDLKSQTLGQGCQPAPLSSATPASAPHSAAYSPSSLLGRHIYYTSPFYSNYTNYGNFNALQSQGILRYNSAAVASNEGLSQTVLNASSVHKQSSDSLKTITNQLEQHYRPSSYDSKKGR